MKQRLFSIVLTLVMLCITFAATSAKVTIDTTDVSRPDTMMTDEVEAYSDTTATDTTGVNATPLPDDWDDWGDWDDASTQTIMEGMGFNGKSLAELVFVLCVLLIIFVLAPVILIGLVLYFVYKNRRERLRIAEMAMRSGKSIPFDAMGSPMSSNDMLRNKGIRQMFLGAGLALLLWFPLGKMGLAIGALILLIGCGNLVIAHQSQKKVKNEEWKSNPEF